MKVLIADDGLTIRRLLTLHLTQWGYQVVAAADGNEAWEILRRADTPRLMILDWLMPGIDGIEICRKARLLDHGRLLHIIIFTSLERKENLITALHAGADDFIPKQFDMKEFQARLHVGARMVNIRAELAKRILDLEQAVAHIKRLHGLLPICMHCHSIRDEKEDWQNLEKYLAERADINFSHGLCPKCMNKYYKE